MTTVVDDKVGELERENAELRRRLAEREAELAEALGRETANVEILQVINPLPGDLEPVFDAILDKALDLCGASFGHLLSWDGEYLNRAAARGASPDEAFLQRYTPIPERHSRDRSASGEAYRAGSPGARVLVDRGGARSYAAVALRKDGALLGGIAIYRTDVHPFTDKQMVLLQSFAQQAVIAMERWRTRGSSPRREKRLNSRPQWPKCSESSIPRRAISRRCSSYAGQGNAAMRLQPRQSANLRRRSISSSRGDESA
jgi:GAF domain-containing protein